MKSRFSPSDWILSGAAGLSTLGLLMVYSATSVRPDGGAIFLRRSILWIALGWAALLIVRRLDYRRWISGSTLLLAVALALLAGVLIPGLGSQIGGARRWYRLGSLSFQPSEVVKYALPIYLASLWARGGRGREGSWNGRKLAGPLVACGATCLLLILEPDFGTAVLVSIVALAMLLIAGMRLRVAGILAGVATVVFAAAILASPYRLKRVTAFLDPWEDPRGVGYQSVQAQLAIGSGGLFGKGVGAGVQKRYYVPAIHSDFILAQVAEEMGLLGLAIVAAGVGTLLAGCWRVARGSDDPAGALLTLGILLTIGFQAVINAAVVLGVAPTKGIPFPLVSFGGSAMFMTLAALGVVLNVGDVSAGRPVADG